MKTIGVQCSVMVAELVNNTEVKINKFQVLIFPIQSKTAKCGTENK